MFGGPGNQPSEAEVREGEMQATANVQIFAIACAALWFSPHVIDWARNLFDLSMSLQYYDGIENRSSKMFLYSVVHYVTDLSSQITAF